jgi:hypothetical protein
MAGEKDTDARYLLECLSEAVDETRRSLRDGRTEHYRGDAAELKRRATELAGRLDTMADQGGEAI